jgi:hypothetical protein
MANLKFWTQRSDGAYAIYEGMEQTVIDAMLLEQGLTVTYMTESDWLAAQPPIGE